MGGSGPASHNVRRGPLLSQASAAKEAGEKKWQSMGQFFDGGSEVFVTHGSFDTKYGKCLRLFPVLLLLLLCASTNAAFASPLSCNVVALDVAMGNTIACGTIVYDFTLTIFGAQSTFGTPLGASDILVSPNFDSISFSVKPSSFTYDPGGSPIAASQGLFYADGSNTGYTVYTIPFQVSITSGFWFAGITTTATDLFFGKHNGGQDSIDVQKIVTFDNPNDPFDPNNPYAYSADANTGQIDTSSSNSDLIIPYLSSGFQSLDPFSPTTMNVYDTLTLDATTNGPVPIWVGPDGFTQNFATPEPLTLLTLGSSLVLIGILGRKRKLTAAATMEQK